jgi:hypothetical protein
MRLKKYIVNEMSMPGWITNAFEKTKDELEKYSFEQFKKKCEAAFTEVNKKIPEEEMFELEQQLDIPTSMRYHNRNKNESIINEDVAHLWNLIKTEAFPTLAFYPALQVWLELDKILKGTEYSGRTIVFYAAFWLLLMSGKHIAHWNKWRKENPEEYRAERAQGKGRVV